jgi:hypothetical protein
MLKKIIGAALLGAVFSGIKFAVTSFSRQFFERTNQRAFLADVESRLNELMLQTNMAKTSSADVLKHAIQTKQLKTNVESFATLLQEKTNSNPEAVAQTFALDLNSDLMRYASGIYDESELENALKPKQEVAAEMIRKIDKELANQPWFVSVFLQ